MVWPHHDCIGDCKFVTKVVMGLPGECEIWIFEGDCEEALVCKVDTQECRICLFERDKVWKQSFPSLF